MIASLDLSVISWLVLIVAAFFVGISKTALPGLTTVSVALFAAVLPARESTATLLLLLLVGDLMAVWIYIKTVDWRRLVKLLPWVLIGVVTGAIFLAWVDDKMMRVAIGIILLSLTALTLLVMTRISKEQLTRTFARRAASGFYGGLGGFTTMAANAGGPVMSLYFIASGFDVKRFLGTQSWFFFIVNIIKLPFSAGIGLINEDTLKIDLGLAPVVIIASFVGKRMVGHIDRKLFNTIVLALTVVSSVYLLIPTR